MDAGIPGLRRLSRRVSSGFQNRRGEKELKQEKTRTDSGLLFLACGSIYAAKLRGFGVSIAAQALNAAVLVWTAVRVLVWTAAEVPVLIEVEVPALIRVEALAGVGVVAARDGSPAAVEDGVGELAAGAARRVERAGLAAVVADVVATQDAAEVGLPCFPASAEPGVGLVCFRVGSGD